MTLQVIIFPELELRERGFGDELDERLKVALVRKESPKMSLSESPEAENRSCPYP